MNICEQVEIAIYSDMVLTDEQKNHIENCPECKALLSQVESMKNDLHSSSITGIEEGTVTKKVMDEIRKQKLSSPAPKFRITHHLGTAAAVAIILVATLIIKNPADTSSNESISYDKAVSDEVRFSQKAYFGTSTYNNAETEEAAIDAENGAPILMMAKAAPKADEPAQNKMMRAKTASFDSDDNIQVLNDSIEEAQPEAYLYSAGGGGASANIFSMEEFGGDLLSNIEIANKIIFERFGIENYFSEDDFSSNEDFLAAVSVFTHP